IRLGGRPGGRQIGRANTNETISLAGRLRLQQWSGCLIERFGKLCRSAEPPRPGQRLEVRGLQLQMHGMARELVAFQAARHLFAERPEFGRHPIGAGDILVERRLGRNAFYFAVGVDAPAILAAGETIKAAAYAAIASNERDLLLRSQITNCCDAVRGKLGLQRLAYSPNEAD